MKNTIIPHNACEQEHKKEIKNLIINQFAPDYRSDIDKPHGPETSPDYEIDCNQNKIALEISNGTSTEVERLDTFLYDVAKEIKKSIRPLLKHHETFILYIKKAPSDNVSGSARKILTCLRQNYVAEKFTPGVFINSTDYKPGNKLQLPIRDKDFDIQAELTEYYRGQPQLLLTLDTSYPLSLNQCAEKILQEQLVTEYTTMKNMMNASKYQENWLAIINMQPDLHAQNYIAAFQALVHKPNPTDPLFFNEKTEQEIINFFKKIIIVTDTSSIDLKSKLA